MYLTISPGEKPAGPVLVSMLLPTWTAKGLATKLGSVPLPLPLTGLAPESKEPAAGVQLLAE